MTIIGKLNNLEITFNGEKVLECIRADIPAGKRIGIIGANGTGKSSLLNAIAESVAAVQWVGQKPSIAYMKQEVKEPKLNQETFESSKLETQWNVPDERSGLSGGELMKVRLAEALSEKAGILLLDEPTNHLDEVSVRLVIKQLKSYSGTIILVSHDRQFLDSAVTCIWALEDKKLTVYEGNYSRYSEQREHQQLELQRKYAKQQKKIAQIEKQISKLQSWSGKAHAESTKQEGFKEFYRSKAKRMDVQIKSKRRRLEGELEKESVRQPKEAKAIKFDIGDSVKKGKRVMELKSAGKSFGSKTLFKNASFTVLHGERIGLIGNNGSGKSTFFKMLQGEEDYSGEIWVTRGMTVGYLSQYIYDLPEEKTPAELFCTESYEYEGEVRTLMSNLGFNERHWREPIGHMSMGERVKLKLMVFMLAKCDVLLLDEPTNHLDLPSRERLEKTLSTFSGTLMIASHDRYFVKKLTDKLLIFERGQLQKVERTYEEWTNREKEIPHDILLQLETERQAVLGKLSFLKPGDSAYTELDQRFNILTVAIKAAKLRE